MMVMNFEHRAFSPGEKAWLLERFGSHAVFGHPLGKHTSLGVGGPAQVLVRVQDSASLADLVRWTGERGFPYFLLGRGTNLLVRDNGVQGVVIRLSGDFGMIETQKSNKNHCIIRAGAGAGLGKLCSLAISEGLKGLNFGVGIPGTVGGAILMNAGTHKGCVADSIHEVWFTDSRGEEVCLAGSSMSWSYRKMEHPVKGEPGRPPIITGGLFRTQVGDPQALRQEADAHMKRRKATQPQGVQSAGSFFKNPPGGRSAGELIDKAGLKGKKIGGAMVSPAHANWIVNTGNATAQDVFSLMDLVQDKVLKVHGITLAPEVKIVGT